MRLTAINLIGKKKPYKVRKLNAPNQFRLAKFLWESGRRRRAESTGDKELLLSKGFHISSPADIISAPYDTPKYEDFFPKKEEVKLVQEPLHRVDSEMLPLLAVCTDLMQRFCWSVISEELPSSITERQRVLSEGEKRRIEECILSSHLLESTMDRLPLTDNYELPNRIEKPRSFDMPHGIPVARKNHQLTTALLETFDHTGLDPLQLLSRPHLDDVSLVCNMLHMDKLVRLQLPTAKLVCGYGPALPPVLPVHESDLFVAPEVDEKTQRMILRKQIAAETGGPLQQPLPDVGPLLPFIGASVLDEYTHHPTQYTTSNKTVHPHTVHIHHNAPALYTPYSVGLNTHQLTALTMVNLYAHALTYAVTSGAKIDSAGRLETPIVVQGVHSHVNMFQPAVFQLNTIGPNCFPLLDTSWLDREHATEDSKITSKSLLKKMAALPQLEEEAVSKASSVRNVFFCRAFEEIYVSCDYDKTAKPSLKGVNYKLVSLLRAMHET